MRDLIGIERLQLILQAHLGDDQLRGSVDRPSSTAVLAETDQLSPSLLESLKGIRLYRHQAEALALTLANYDTVLTTEGNSGKSLPFHLAAHERFTQTRSSALVLCPTRAVVADQVRSLSQLWRSGAVIAALGGDDPHERRVEIGRTCDILVTTPDLLHSYVLAHHQRFSRLFRRLGQLHLEEVHAYRGLFGANVASLLRRLLRVCAHYGSLPTLTAASGTLTNPVSFLYELTTREFTTVFRTGAPAALQRTVIVEPSSHSKASYQPGSTLHTCARLLAGFTTANIKTICFASSRENAERVVLETRRKLSKELCDTVTSYRAGYLAQERQLLDVKLHDATLRSVVATPALEFGATFDAFSVALLQGFPGSIASLRQRAARVGRDGSASLVVIITQPNALDSYFASHVEELINREPEWLSISLRSERIVANHLTCAAYEAPLQDVDEEPWSLPVELKKPSLRATRSLVEQGVLAYRNHHYYYVPQELPHRLFALRERGRVVHIVDLNGEIIGSSDDLRAPSTLYPGARYLHLGTPYDVVAFDQDAGLVTVSLASSERRSHAIVETTVEVDSAAPGIKIAGIETTAGSITVQRHVLGFNSNVPGGPVTSEPLNLAPLICHCEALWLAFPSTVKNHFTDEERYCALHALEHVMLSLSPLIGLCDQSDLDAVTVVDGSLDSSPRFQGGVILLYEREEEASGLTEMISTRITELLDLSYDLIQSCRCLQGCPNCVLSPRCNQLNDRVSRPAAVRLLEFIRKGRLD